MKSIDVKIEKANAIFKYRRVQKITTMFRFMEMVVLLVMISRFSSQLPFSAKVSGDYFRGISFMLFLSPKFVFVIGNVIILILFLNSRVVKNSYGDGNDDLCYEYVKSCETSALNTITVNSTTPPPPPPPPPPPSPHPPPAAAVVVVPVNQRKICRSRSDNPIGAKCKDSQTHRELRRSATEMSRSKNFGLRDGDTAAMDKRDKDDELSSEDFRQTVEAFIARQQKMLREEEFSPMVYIGS